MASPSHILSVYQPNCFSRQSTGKCLYCLYGEQTKGTTFNIGPAHEHATTSCWQGSHKQCSISAGMSGVVSVFPNRKLRLQTTRSWDFMGFSQKIERATTESDVIIGAIDSGIWPESESFNDTGFGPPPTKWRGTCQVSANFTCNKSKILPEQWTLRSGRNPFSERFKRTRDTHCINSSQKPSQHDKFLRLWPGNRQGRRPILPYCSVQSLLVGFLLGSRHSGSFRRCHRDGVDIISVSLGGNPPLDYFNDSIAIGSFHAMRNGILTSISAGNEGPEYSTISNIAPWFLSVAASTIDRNFSTKVQLGNNIFYEGISINTVNLKNTMYPLIYGGDEPNVIRGSPNTSSRLCNEDSLDKNLVKGKIVLCDLLDSGEGPFYAGAAGTVIRDTTRRDYANNFPLPTSYVNNADGSNILTYIKSTDITAAGVNILAAWTPLSSVSEVKGDNRFAPYNMVSGTSMSCPHVSAIAA
ncbi:hypothetical protein Ddye_032233 [Dipteronia dyeriana]|uniref:Peptidase S8/S53 domain-containing protein n=1 Tax=Dipteronia dyeriana TaxID=168575 RepID=A0AAD9WNC5_9ROSI|nr:hypothetical protein Ddye_032233 [Dipteronia dyeriana]